MSYNSRFDMLRRQIHILVCGRHTDRNLHKRKPVGRVWQQVQGLGLGLCKIHCLDNLCRMEAQSLGCHCNGVLVGARNVSELQLGVCWAVVDYPLLGL